jgi:hypothetical protein
LEAASSASEAAGGFVPAPDVISVETVAALASPTGVTSKEGSATARTDLSSEASLELTVPEESVPEVAPNATPVLRAEAPQLIVSSRLPPRLPVGADDQFPQESSPATNVSPERGSPTSSGGSPLSVSSAGRSDQRLPPRVSAPEGNSLSAATAASLPAAPDRPLRRVAFGSSPGAAQSATSKVDGRFGLRSLGEPIGARTIVRPKYLGLLLPLILLGMIAVVALLANVTPGTVVGLFRGSLPTAAAPVVAQEVAAPEAEVAARPLQDQPVAAAVRPAADSAEAQATGLVLDVEDAAAAAAAVAAAMTAPQTEHPSAGAERVSGLAAQPAPTDSSVPTADAERIYAATGLWLDAPRLPGLPEAAGTTAEAPALGTLSMDKALAELPSLAALSPDPSLSAPIDPPLPGQSLAQGGDTPVAFTPDGAVAPSGPPVHAGSPALLPPSLPGEPSAAESMPTPTGWVNAIAEPPSQTPPDRPAVPEGFGATVAAADAVQGPPAPASAEAGAAWVNSLAEPPSVSPRARPDLPVEALAALASAAPPEVDPTAELGGALALAAPETEGPSLGAVSLDGLRPMSRPADLEPAEPPVQVLTSFEGPRPGARPEGLAPEAPDVTDALAEALAAPEAPPTEEPVRAPDLQSTLAAIVEGAPDPLAGATRLAVAAARVPEGRPRNFDRVVREQLESVASARAAQEERRPNGGGEGTSLEEHEAAESDGNAEVASSAAAAPSGPTATTVAAAATLSDAMALREINLIGVYGQPGARRALVRMDNGRYLRVGIGDNLDGGQVTAIGDNALNYVRRGRTEVLVIPGG